MFEGAANTVKSLKTDIEELLKNYYVKPEVVARMTPNMDECYNYLHQLKLKVLNSELYCSLQNIFEKLSFVYVSIEAYQNGFLSLPLLKSALKKSGIIIEFEKIVSIIEMQYK